MIPQRLELGTFRVGGERNNRYPTITAEKSGDNRENIDRKNQLCFPFYSVLFLLDLTFSNFSVCGIQGFQPRS